MKCTYCSPILPQKQFPKRQPRLVAKHSFQWRANYRLHMIICLKNASSLPWEVWMFVFIQKWDKKLKYTRKKKATKTLFEEENEARIRMFLTFSIKTKLFAWKCQIRKHNASFQNVDISDISKCRHFRDFSTLPKVEMSKCQFKIKHFILNFPIRKLEIFTQF